MNMVTALAITVGVVFAVWIKLSQTIGLGFWYVGVFGWAAYMAAGGGVTGLRKAIPSGVLGMALVAAAEMTALVSGRMELEWLLLAVASFIIVLLSRFSLFSFIPAAFAGAAVIGAGGPVGIFDAVTNTKLGIAFVVGTFVGYVTDLVAKAITKKA